ncbi:hypothetical protein [Alloalcanivorax xenomutans]|uniref:hypothetical protein n=1 Tax=Alloalcanivorax xenomutans TaxID=1094342 RepID=UPI00300AC48C
MAVVNGTATDAVDLYNKLYDFLTAHPDLVAAGQAWERVTSVGLAPPLVADTDTAEDGIKGAVMLKGPGMAGQDEIFVSLYLYDNTAINRQMIYLHGHNGVFPESPRYDGHINTSPRKGFVVWNQPMAYWLVASGRRFYGRVKLGTVYQPFYGGLYLPYALPQTNPYPLAIGGTTALSTSDVGQETTGNIHCAFFDPYSIQLAALNPAGSWDDYDNGTSADDYDRSSGGARLFPYNCVARPRTLDVQYGDLLPPPSYRSNYSYAKFDQLQSFFIRNQTPLLGGGYLLTPITLHSGKPGVPGTFGILDGVFHVSGVDNVSDNIVQVNGVDHLVVQNVYRTSTNSYAALRLE